MDYKENWVKIKDKIIVAVYVKVQNMENIKKWLKKINNKKKELLDL